MNVRPGPLLSPRRLKRIARRLNILLRRAPAQALRRSMRRLTRALAARSGLATWVPPGHFYSPLVDPVELSSRRARVFDRTVAPTGIDLNTEGQLNLVRRLAAHYPALPIVAGDAAGLRYRSDNPTFGPGDAAIYGCLLMEVRPRRLVEFGTGYSSCLALDVDERCLGGTLDCTFIDPYPERFRTLHGRIDPTRHRVIKSAAQDIDLGLVDALNGGDILFVDSTHVSKTGSDVNFHLFTVLPRLKPGVIVQFHDIFYPFEYPEAWLFAENRSWNEAYALRALLTDNPNYRILLFNDYLGRRHADAMSQAMPLFMRNPGASLWLQKV
ncbi:MAG: class I SAM-dependent methyltransferase [Rhodospirillaceae bacterium]|nr:class I SAM-dependent methyltransferase [Rhodospirillaceae bacterium]